jgi:LEA14-like dessication related protein
MKLLKPLFFIGGGSLLAYAFYKYYLSQKKFIEQIKYKFVGLKIITISKEDITLDITVNLFNGSDVAATVKEMYLDVMINNVVVGNINEVKDVVIMSKKSTNFIYRFSFNPQLIFKNIVDLISFSIQAKNLNFDVKGYVNIDFGIYKTTLPFTYKDNLKNILKLK